MTGNLFECPECENRAVQAVSTGVYIDHTCPDCNVRMDVEGDVEVEYVPAIDIDDESYYRIVDTDM